MEDQALISKADLLKKYDISYGALYRWKRMGLIPEEWFIKKAVKTGQQTFFPKALMCERIELIKNKDDVLLSDLSEQLKRDGRKNECLVVSTRFGEQKISISDIRSVYVTNVTGEKIDLKELIMQTIERYGAK